MNLQHNINAVSLADLTDIANAMMRHLPNQIAIGLVGTLGAGKTTMTQAIAQAAGIDAAEVTSPTFTLLQSHQIQTDPNQTDPDQPRSEQPIKLHHLDAYRLADEDEFYELGVDELFDENAWTLVEWADRVRTAMPPETLWIEIEIADRNDRRNLYFQTDSPSIDAAMTKVVKQVS